MHWSFRLVGYQTDYDTLLVKEKEIQFEKELYPLDSRLQEVEISAHREGVENKEDRKKYNVSNQAINSTGTAKDLLLSLPSVDMDAEGKLSYRGSTKVLILVDGEQSNLVQALDQIPADQIDFIEVNNNPSVKYRAEGAVGLIHIHTKKQKGQGSQTQLNIYAGLPENMGASVGYSFHKQKFSFYVRPGFTRKKQFQTKEHWRENFENSMADDYYQYDRQDETLNAVVLNAGMKYQINKKQSLSVDLLGSGKFDHADRSIYYKSEDKQDIQSYASNKDIDISNENKTLDLNIKYQAKGKLNKQLFSARANYSYFNQLYQLDNSWLNEGNFSLAELQNTQTLQDNRKAGLELNYQYPFHDSLLFYFGYAGQLTDLINDFRSESYNYVASDWISDTSLNNYFHFIQNIQAAYLGMEFLFSRASLDLGTRLEYTDIEQSNRMKDNYLDLFPRAFFSYRLRPNTSTSVSLSRRINRPTLRMFNPYVREYADILNMHQGNPDLKPEYVLSAEVALRQVYEKVSWGFSLYYRDVDDAISRVKYGSNDSAFLVTFMNFARGEFAGIEPDILYKPSSKWNLSFSGNVFYSHLKGEYSGNKIDKSHWVYHLSLGCNVKLPWKLNAQFRAFYRSTMPSVFGTYLDRYWMDMAISRKVLKGKGKVIFKVSDVFNTWRYGLDLLAVGDDDFAYTQKNRRKNQSQYFSIGFQYNVKSATKEGKKKGNFYLDEMNKQ